MFEGLKQNVRDFGQLVKEGSESGYTPEQLADMKKAYDEGQLTMSPMERAAKGVFFKNYGDGKSQFAKDYGRYYSPFMQSVNASHKDDLVEPHMKQSKFRDSGYERERKRRYNKKMTSLSAYDPIASKVGGGLGALAGGFLGGGVGGHVGGYIGRKALPFVYDKIKRYLSEKKSNNNKYGRNYIKRYIEQKDLGNSNG